MTRFRNPLLTLLPILALAAPGETGASLLVEAIPPGSPLAAAGLAPGDVLLAWRLTGPQPASPVQDAGTLARWSDFTLLLTEQAPRGPIRLTLRRVATPFEIEVPAGDWNARVRPLLDDAGERAFAEVSGHLANDDAEAALAVLAALGTRLAAARQPDLAAWASMRRASVCAATRRFDDATTAFSEAATRSVLAGDRAGELAALIARARVRLTVNDADGADAAFGSAISIARAAFPASLTLARALSDQARVAAMRGDLRRAEELLEEALGIESAQVPDSLELAKTLNNLSIVRMDRGDLGGAEALRGRSYRIIARLAPGSATEAQALNNLGIVAAERGDLVIAEAFYRRALELKERLGTDAEDLALTVMNLGLLALDRDDPDQAASAFDRALELFERSSPGGPRVADAHVNLGNAAVAAGDLDSAGRHYGMARAIYHGLAPGGTDEASCLTNLAAVARRRGSLGEAGDLLAAALEIWQREAPGGLEQADTVRALGKLTADRGDLEAAEGLLRRASATADALAPGTARVAETRHDLARVLRARGRTAEAVTELAAAADAIEEQTRRLGGGDEAGARFRAGHREIYTDLVDALLELGRPADAFSAVERARARIFLAMLATRDVRFDRDVDPELVRRQSLLRRDHREALDALAGAGPGAPEAEVQALRARIADVRSAEAVLDAEILAASPRLAALRDPRPLDLAAARESLEEGTLLAEFVVEADRTLLFLLSREAGLTVAVVGVRAEDLRRRVGRLRAAIQSATFGDVDTSEVEHASAELYELLLSPAAAALSRADRLVVVPDGPLHRLPFAALGRRREGSFRYLVEDLPVSSALSATVLAELSRRPATGNNRVVAFADPAYPEIAEPGSLANPAVRSALERGFELRRLPATGAEADSVTAVFGERATVLRGAEATEERARAVPTGVAVLHFACHGLLDESDPLASSLALSFPTAPGDTQEDGLLAAWEILQDLRADLDLVTLSACQTGLGRELGDEGVVGLSRAFQVAGASTVVASLWSVADASTAALMRAFYRELAAGRPKDAALRTAQLQLLHGTPGENGVAARHPFFWAPFTVNGAYR